MAGPVTGDWTVGDSLRCTKRAEDLQKLHWGRKAESGGRFEADSDLRTPLITKGMAGRPGRVAFSMQYNQQMKSYIGDTVRRLLELHSLEERLSVLRRDKQERADAQTLIESLRANLTVGVMGSHDRFRAAGKRSVAEVRHGVCSACHMGVAIGLLAQLRRGEGLHRCGNCGRYLYLVEEEEADRQPVRRRPRRTEAVVSPA